MILIYLNLLWNQIELKLKPWLPVLWKAIPAIYRPALCGLERYFAFISTIGTSCLVHFSWASEASSALKSTVSHLIFSCSLTATNKGNT
jgi:hypothetical protein